MGELVTLAGIHAAGIVVVLTFLKKAPILGRLPDYGWLLLAAALGVGGALWLDIDVSSLPVRGPRELTQAIVGLFAGFGSRLGYEAVETVKAKRAEIKARPN